MAFVAARGLTSAGVGVVQGVLPAPINTITTGVLGVIGSASPVLHLGLPEHVADGMVDGSLATLGYEFAGLGVLVGVVGLLSLGTIVVIEAAQQGHIEW